jgi:hypothetical protein
MVKWFCSSSLCYNHFRTKTSNGEAVKFYRLPRDAKLQAKYKKILKTEGINWKSGHICCEHWSAGAKKDNNDPPDLTVPPSQIPIIENKFVKAKERYEKLTLPNNTDKRKLKVLKRKLEIAKLNQTPCSSNNRKEPTPRDTYMSTPKKSKRVLSKRELFCKLNASKSTKNNLQQQLDEANEKIKKLTAENKASQIKINYLKMSLERKNKYNVELKQSIAYIRKLKFSYEILKLKPTTFEYLCGLPVEKFEMLYNVVLPYMHTIKYPDCKGTGERCLDKASELLSVLMICRHSLHLGVMAYILNIGKSTVYRIFVGWIVFLETLFTELDLKPDDGFLLKKMPDIFVKTGHGLTDMIIDCTEFKFQHATNYELNSLMFSNYKNTVTGKALIGISPHGSGLLFSDIYPGSISDSAITEKTSVLEWIRSEHELMADRGFSVQDYCSVKGVYLNRPAQKDNNQFSQSDVASNFDIASTRIHVERFIGRVRDWSILNSVWPLQRMDLLSSTWQTLCHIINLTMSPIGPKDA